VSSRARTTRSAGNVGGSRVIARERKLARLSTRGRLAMERLADLDRRIRELEAEKLAVAAEFVEANPPESLADFEGEFPVAGPGAPAVAEFSIAALSAALSMTNTATRHLLGDAVEIKFRLPRLWALVQSHRVPVWKVRRVCGLTSQLPLAATLWIDEELAADPKRVNTFRIEKLAEIARAEFDPEAHAEVQAQLAEHYRVQIGPTGINFSHPTPALSKAEMILDTPAANQLEATIATIAGVLAELGSTESLDRRRALAAGMLGDPQAAADLINGVGLPTKPPVATTLVVHFNAESMVGVDEKLGAVTAEMVRDWIGCGRVNIRPVIDLASSRPGHEPVVDRHDPTDEMREQVIMRNRVCVFPGCGRDSRSCDLDHVIPYVEFGHPDWKPGQTRPSNLAPVCRFHHRVKTHTGWSYLIDDSGGAEWITPERIHYTKPAINRRP
jgi:hypothetical protein